jgi:Bacterial archaeo-eukaryotic release factor family 6
LNRREIKLYEGNRDVLDEIEIALGVPRTITDALGEELTEPHLTVASYGQGGIANR